jgi:hypothetical protein
VDAHRLETASEFLEVKYFITVLIQFLEKVNGEVLEGGEFLGGGKNFREDVVYASFGENAAIVLHVLLSVFVGRDKHELKTREEDGAANKEIALTVVPTSDGVLLLLTVNEGSSNATRVLVANFIDMDGVVTTVIADNEGARLIIRLGRDKAGVKPQDVHVLLEHLLHVELWRLGLEGDDGTHSILFGTVASVSGNGLVEYSRGGFFQGDGVLLNVEVLAVPLLGVVISVVNEALAAPDVNGLTAM